MATKNSTKKSTREEKPELKGTSARKLGRSASARRASVQKALAKVADKELDKEEARKDKKSSKKKAAVAVATTSGKLTSTQQGHAIQRLMQASPMSVKAIAEKLGYSIQRVQSHVDYEVSKNRANIDSKGRVLIGDRQPKYRNEA